MDKLSAARDARKIVQISSTNTNLIWVWIRWEAFLKRIEISNAGFLNNIDPNEGVYLLGKFF